MVEEQHIYYKLQLSILTIQQLPSAGDDNQSCRILTVIFNRTDQLRIPDYNIYSGTLLYTNISISTALRVCALSLCCTSQEKYVKSQYLIWVTNVPFKLNNFGWSRSARQEHILSKDCMTRYQKKGTDCYPFLRKTSTKVT